MKQYKAIQLEVIVGLGDDTEFLEKEPPFKTVTHLHIELEDWLGDDLMECHPCYVVTEKLKTTLEKSDYTGFEFDDMKTTKAESFKDYYQLNKPVPKFYRMKITGKENIDDVYIGEGYVLYAREEFIDYLKNNFSVKHLDIDPERNEFDDLLDRMIAERKTNK